VEELRGKTALVTGAAKRLGRAVAEALAREGVDVVVHYKSSEAEAFELCRRLQAQGRRAWAVSGDLADPQVPEDLFSRAWSLSGGLQYVVNCAASFPSHDIWEAQPEDFHHQLQLNALAPFLLGRALARRAERGCVVNFLDSSVVYPSRYRVPYHLSKQALLDLTRTMALAFAPKIRVNAVAPGPVLRPPGKGAEFLEARARDLPLGRVGRPEDVVKAVLFLLESDFVTGQVIFVDGGDHIGRGLTRGGAE